LEGGIQKDYWFIVDKYVKMLPPVVGNSRICYIYDFSKMMPFQV